MADKPLEGIVYPCIGAFGIANANYPPSIRIAPVPSWDDYPWDMFYSGDQVASSLEWDDCPWDSFY
ncbi:MAG: hypothetical protein WC852_02695 [Candidatus Nanoarchaeia archaeon]|jgi:hypothetical protein